MCVPKNRRSRSPFLLILILFAIGIASAAVSVAQSPSPARSSARSRAPGISPAEAELKRRISAAQAAQRAKDPAAVALANNRLIALGLRELGQLRLLESAYTQAAELYRRALEFEDVP